MCYADIVINRQIIISLNSTLCKTIDEYQYNIFDLNFHIGISMETDLCITSSISPVITKKDQAKFYFNMREK